MIRGWVGAQQGQGAAGSGAASPALLPWWPAFGRCRTASVVTRAARPPCRDQGQGLQGPGPGEGSLPPGDHAGW